MIIKRKQTTGQPAPNSEFGTSGLPKSQPALEWTPEAVDAGEVPERRSGELSKDRRRGWRRVEDKELISKAWEEANAIRENAQREGFEAGLEESRTIVDELQATLQGLLNAREEALASVAGDIAAIAVEVAERVIKTEVACDETLVLALVRDTIQKAGRSSKTILVKVHPDDVQLVKRDLRDEPIANLQAELIVMEDPTIDQGSCMVETNSGMIDASFSTQLQILKQLFGVSKEPGV